MLVVAAQEVNLEMVTVVAAAAVVDMQDLLALMAELMAAVVEGKEVPQPAALALVFKV